MNSAQKEAALTVLKTELEAATEERLLERLATAIQTLEAVETSEE